MDENTLTTIALIIGSLIFLMSVVILNRSVKLWIRKDGIYFSLNRHEVGDGKNPNEKKGNSNHDS